MGTEEVDFRLLFEESPDVLLVLRPDAPRFTIASGTRAYFRATHITSDVIGRGLFEVFPDNPDDPTADGTANLRASLERVVRSRAPDSMAVQRYDIRRPDGSFESRYWSPKNTPVLSPQGALLYILHRVEDVTELVRISEAGDALRDRTRAMEIDVVARSRELAEANRELREANAKLGELDAAKTVFFGNVSHELRTPLTLVLGPLEDALSDPDVRSMPQLRTQLELAHDNAVRLLELVNTLLDFARLEAGRLRARFAAVDLSDVTCELAAMFHSAIVKAGLRFSVECPPLSEPAWIDRDMWARIVPNLVSNAFKFTFQGEISVRTSEESSFFVVEVSDTGIGIPETEIDRVFERFHRVEGRRGRTHEGSGIGLALVHELVALHGGRISAKSVVGAGTTFRIELPKGNAHLAPGMLEGDDEAESEVVPAPRARATASLRWAETTRPPSLDATAANDVTRERGPRPRVLVVDDNSDVRRYMVGLLAPHYDVKTADDGLAALDLVPTFAPELVLSDVMMPELDGIGLVKRLREDPKTASIPVILLSARAGEDAAIEGLDAGSDDYLVKPFSSKELLARVRTNIGLARTRSVLVERLERTNRELDAFSYSVSHDLRAPLRAIDGFSGALQEDHGEALGADGRKLLERVRSNVEKMSSLIEALLSLARITRAALRVEDIAVEELAEAVVADLRRESPNRRVTVTVARGLRARADRRLLEVALVNLIGNAWKFTARREDAHIEVGQIEGVVPTFFVRDDGAGFDARYATRLFAPFQRLHTNEEFDGTGIGLATVQRIVARHNGRVWAESDGVRGATFYFTLDATPTA